MLFGFLRRVTIAIIDLKETIIFMALCSCQTCKENYADISAVSPIFVVLQPNLQDMLTITQRTCTLHFVFLSASLLLLVCFQVGIIDIIYAN